MPVVTGKVEKTEENLNDGQDWPSWDLGERISRSLTLLGNSEAD